MQDITIGRFDQDPKAQGVIRPKDDSWQLVIDKDGYPHLYVRVKDETGHTGMLCIEDMMIGEGEVSIPDLMQSTFGEPCEGEDAQKAYEEHMERIARTHRPCPRP